MVDEDSIVVYRDGNPRYDGKKDTEEWKNDKLLHVTYIGMDGAVHVLHTPSIIGIEGSDDVMFGPRVVRFNGRTENATQDEVQEDPEGQPEELSDPADVPEPTKTEIVAWAIKQEFERWIIYDSDLPSSPTWTKELFCRLAETAEKALNKYKESQ